MENQLVSISQNCDHIINENPRVFDCFFEECNQILSKLNNDAEVKIKNFGDNQKKKKSTLRELEEDILELEEKEKSLEKVYLELKSKNSEIDLSYQSALKCIEGVSLPDPEYFIKQKENLDSDISALSTILSLHINISKIKWDLDSKSAISGKILKDNDSVSFKFNTDTPNFRTVNELWKMIDR